MVRATAKPRAAVAGVATLPSPAAFLAPPSVLARPGSHRPWSHSTRLPSSAAARSLRLTPTRPSHAARLLPIMAEGGGEAPPAPSSPSAPADVPAAAGGVSQLTGPARARQEEKVRKALSEAERLKQLAAEARYVSSRGGSALYRFSFWPRRLVKRWGGCVADRVALLTSIVVADELRPLLVFRPSRRRCIFRNRTVGGLVWLPGAVGAACGGHLGVAVGGVQVGG